MVIKMHLDPETDLGLNSVLPNQQPRSAERHMASLSFMPPCYMCTQEQSATCHKAKSVVLFTFDEASDFLFKIEESTMPRIS